MMKDKKSPPLILVRGGGDIATGTIHKFHQCGFSVVALEIGNPSSIRRRVSFSEAVYSNMAVVEGVTCRRMDSLTEIQKVLEEGEIPLLIDETGETIRKLHPRAVIDGILAKRNLGTTRDMASITIGLGPGFTAPQDVQAVIETKRGHDLGRIYYSGSAIPNTGIPGVIAGYGKERVIHANASGVMQASAVIGEIVKTGQVLGLIGDTEVFASINGILRGMISDGYPVVKGMKIADIDPRVEEQKNCNTISDKARCIAGSALEAYLHLESLTGEWGDSHDIL